MGLTANVVANTPILSAWGNEIRDRSVQAFATAAERSAQWPTPPTGATSHLASTPGVLYVYNGTAWVVGGGAGAMLVKKRTAGDLSIPVASFANWADYQNSDFATVIPAAVGDVLTVTLDGTWTTTAGGVGFLDAYLLASGSSFGASTAGTGTGNGVQGWGGHAIAGIDPFNGTAYRTIVLADLAAGAATIRLRARVQATNQTLAGNAVAPLTLTTRNLGPAI